MLIFIKRSLSAIKTFTNGKFTVTSEINRLIEQENKTRYVLKFLLKLVHKIIESNSRVNFPPLTF